MSVKVICTGFTDLFWLDVVNRLHETYGWEPIYWVARFNVENPVRDRFPQLVFQSTTDAVRALVRVTP